MKAARFHAPGTPLSIEDVPNPVLEAGTAIVQIAAVFLPPYFAEMVDGTAQYPLPPMPFTPGMDSVGIVEQVATDVSGLEIGQPVFCDHYYNTVNIGGAAESCYVGTFGKGERSQKILARWRDGAFAEKMILPAECFTPLGPASGFDPALLVRLGWFGTCYGAILRSKFRAGDTIIVNAATGLVGTAAVLLFMAMGAGRIVACGRRPAVLAELEGLDPKRITTVTITGSDEDTAAMVAASRGGGDVLLDAVGDITDPSSTTRALRALRPYGSGLLVGGCIGDLPIPYKWMLDKQITLLGSSWFPRAATRNLLGMMGGGSLPVEAMRAKPFTLDKINEGINWAAKGPGGLEHAALVF
jgi:alcohol dehydrogenase